MLPSSFSVPAPSLVSAPLVAVTYNATNNPLGATISANTVNLNGAAQTFTVGNSSNAAVDLTISSTVVAGGASGSLTKQGAGTLNLDGLQQYNLLQVSAVGAGVTNLNNTLGTAPGLAILNANSTTNITVSQDLLELNIGTNPPLAPLASFGGGGSGPGVGVVPEPGSMGLLLTGALGLLARRRRRA